MIVLGVSERLMIFSCWLLFVLLVMLLILMSFMGILIYMGLFGDWEKVVVFGLVGGFCRWLVCFVGVV